MGAESLESNKDRLASIYDEEFEYVWRTLRRLGVPKRQLDDVCHDVFMVVWDNLDAYDDDRPIRPWLSGIAFRVASDHLEKASHAREHLTDPDAPAQEPGVLDKLSAERAREVVMEALQSVDPERRPIFVMSELDGHAMPEIADSLDLPLNTAYSRLRLARETFTEAARRILDDREIPDE